MKLINVRIITEVSDNNEAFEDEMTYDFTKFNNCNLLSRNMNYHNFNNCILENADILECAFKETVFSNVVFKRINFLNTRFLNCSFNDVKFENCKFTGINFIDNRFDSVEMTKSLVSYTDFEKCIFNASEISLTNMKDGCLRNCKLEETEFKLLEFTDFIIMGTSLKEIDMTDSKLNNLDVTLDELKGAYISASQALEIIVSLGINLK